MEITQRQLEIIESAGKILTSSGVGGLTIKNLANEMQFSESAIYRHFKSKEDIIVAMLNYLAEGIDDRLKFVLKLDSPEENFKAIFNEQFSFFNKNSHFVVAVFSDGMMEQSLRINEAILKLKTIKMKYLKPILLDGQQKNIFISTISTDDLMHIIMGTFKLQMFKWRIANFEFDICISGNKMVESLLKLIKRETV
jgi:TetR/AcrR family fatty acid metabolism transcriptional regulator